MNRHVLDEDDDLDDDDEKEDEDDEYAIPSALGTGGMEGRRPTPREVVAIVVVVVVVVVFVVTIVIERRRDASWERWELLLTSIRKASEGDVPHRRATMSVPSAAPTIDVRDVMPC